MGLSMYLVGRKSLDWMDETERKEDDFPVAAIEIDFDHWDSSYISPPGFHEYIMETYDEGEKGQGNCRRGILLSEDDLKHIISSLQAGEMTWPDWEDMTVEEQQEQKQIDVKSFETALAWLESKPKATKEKSEWREIFWTWG